MTRIKSGITVICLLVTVQLYARADTMKLHEAKMKMLRAAVGFYSSDPKQPGKGVTCNSLEFPELRECAGGMAHVVDRIDKWNGKPVGDESALQALGEVMLKDITQGDRAYRKKLPTYAKFKERLETLAGTKTDLPVTENGNAAAGTEVVDTIAAFAPKPEPAQGSLPADPARDDKRNNNVVQSESTSVPENKPLWNDSLVISLAALAIAVLAMILVLLKRRRRSQRHSGSRPGMQRGGGESETYNVESVILPLQRKVAELDSELENVNKMIEESERRVMRRIQGLETQHTSDWPSRDQSNHVAAVFPATKKWAKSVDSGGFSIDALAADPDDKMIYEITQTGRDTATFRISDAREAQLFALSNPQNYLREGCTYTTQPALNSQIRTEVPGTLELQGRKWRIIRQAQIAFV